MCTFTEEYEREGIKNLASTHTDALGQYKCDFAQQWTYSDKKH